MADEHVPWWRIVELYSEDLADEILEQLGQRCRRVEVAASRLRNAVLVRITSDSYDAADRLATCQVVRAALAPAWCGGLSEGNIGLRVTVDDLTRSWSATALRPDRPS